MNEEGLLSSVLPWVLQIVSLILVDRQDKDKTRDRGSGACPGELWLCPGHKVFTRAQNLLLGQGPCRTHVQGLIQLWTVCAKWILAHRMARALSQVSTAALVNQEFFGLHDFYEKETLTASILSFFPFHHV